MNTSQAKAVGMSALVSDVKETIVGDQQSLKVIDVGASCSRMADFISKEAGILRIGCLGVTRGLIETAPTPVGDFQCYWTMVLKRRPGMCQLPHGFGPGRKKPLVV